MMDTKTFGEYRSLLRWALCPLVTRCNFVKAIKLNKYNFNNSRVIDKLAAFVVFFLRKKKKGTPNKKSEVPLLWQM